MKTQVITGLLLGGLLLTGCEPENKPELISCDSTEQTRGVPRGGSGSNTVIYQQTKFICRYTDGSQKEVWAN